jgi:2-polyprenyl-3-methyl-5-hydroxy-6-metoxy-1,4-benzoquinol methylase
MTNSFQDHLEHYGIFHFDTNEYWHWSSRKLGSKRAERLNRLRKPITRGTPTKRQLLAFYDFIADPTVAAVVHSLKAGAIKESGEAIARHIKGRKGILDLGCSIGYMTTWFAANDPRHIVTGIDISGPAVNTAVRFSRELSVTNVTFEQADFIQKIPGGPYDAAVDAQTLYAVASESEADFDRAVANIVSALAPNGILVSVPAIGSAQELRPYLDAFMRHGVGLVELEFVTFSDLGDSGGYPVLVLQSGHPGLDVDIDGGYAAVRTQLETLHHQRPE